MHPENYYGPKESPLNRQWAAGKVGTVLLHRRSDIRDQRSPLCGLRRNIDCEVPDWGLRVYLTRNIEACIQDRDGHRGGLGWRPLTRRDWSWRPIGFTTLSWLDYAHFLIGILDVVKVAVFASGQSGQALGRPGSAWALVGASRAGLWAAVRLLRII